MRRFGYLEAIGFGWLFLDKSFFGFITGSGTLHGEYLFPEPRSGFLMRNYESMRKRKRT